MLDCLTRGVHLAKVTYGFSCKKTEVFGLVSVLENKLLFHFFGLFHLFALCFSFG